jgi:hypothetical protein
MLVRFHDIKDCASCTQTIDFDTLRAISMLLNSSTNTYFVRLSFKNGDTVTVKDNMNLSDAITYRNELEGYWLSSESTFTSTVIDA